MTLDRSHWAASNRSNAEPAIKHSEDASLGHVFILSRFASCPIICIESLWSIGEDRLAPIAYLSSACSHLNGCLTVRTLKVVIRLLFRAVSLRCSREIALARSVTIDYLSSTASRRP